MAIIARCLSPPLSWKEYSSTLCSGSGMPTCRSNSTAISRASDLETSWCSLIASMSWLPTV